MKKFFMKTIALLILGFCMGLWLNLGGLMLWAIGVLIYLFAGKRASEPRPRQGL
jgi:type IV secretory pathway TrbD component